MILTDEMEAQLVEAIENAPDRPAVLPDWAYRKNRNHAVIYRDGLPITLHRYLYIKMVGPLEPTLQLINRSDEPKNVNPHLFEATTRRGTRAADHCVNNHPYAGNEMPGDSRYRCRTCYENMLERRAEKRREDAVGGEQQDVVNRAKTHCPMNHEYTPENTIIWPSENRRRCRTCTEDRAKKRWADTKAVRARARGE